MDIIIILYLAINEEISLLIESNFPVERPEIGVFVFILVEDCGLRVYDFFIDFVEHFVFVPGARGKRVCGGAEEGVL